MIESSIYSDLIAGYNVSSVPKVIINEDIEFVGPKQINEVIDYIDKI